MANQAPFWDFVSGMQNPGNDRRRGGPWSHPWQPPQDPRGMPDWSQWAAPFAQPFFGGPFGGRGRPPHPWFAPPGSPPPPPGREQHRPASPPNPAPPTEKPMPREASQSPAERPPTPPTPPESVPEYPGHTSPPPPPDHEGPPGPPRGRPHRHSHHHRRDGPPGCGPHRGRHGGRRGSPHRGHHHGPPPPPPFGRGPPGHGPRGPFPFDLNNIDLNEIARFFTSQLNLDPSNDQPATSSTARTPAAHGGNARAEGEDGTITPEVDTFHLPTKILIHASLPGAKKSDINVSFNPSTSSIEISGVIARPGEIDSTTYGAIGYAERKVGLFRRDVHVELKSGMSVDEEGITARLEDGVLRVEVPVFEEGGWEEVRKVDIE